MVRPVPKKLADGFLRSPSWPAWMVCVELAGMTTTKKREKDDVQLCRACASSGFGIAILYLPSLFICFRAEP